jgi:hypothetical protein
VILKQLQDALLKTTFNPISVFLNLRNQKCKVYDKAIVPQEPTKAMNEIYETLRIEAQSIISR